MGVTSASFPASGNVLVAKEVLMIDMTEGSIKERQSLITRERGIFELISNFDANSVISFTVFPPTFATAFSFLAVNSLCL